MGELVFIVVIFMFVSTISGVFGVLSSRSRLADLHIGWSSPAGGADDERKSIYVTRAMLGFAAGFALAALLELAFNRLRVPLFN